MKKLALLLAVSLIFVGCASSKKKNRVQVSQRTIQTSDIVVNASTQTEENVIRVEVEDEIVLTPVKPEKPIVIVNEKGEKKEITNAVVSVKSKNVNEQKQIIIKDTTSTKVKSEKKQVVEVKQQTKEKETKPSGKLFIIILFIALFIGLILYAKRKFR